MANLVRRAFFREKTTFFKKRSNAVDSIDDTRLSNQNNSESKETTGKKKSNLKGSKSEDFTRFQSQNSSSEGSESRLKGIKNNISAINEKISGAFKSDTSSKSLDSAMNISKPPKTPGRGQCTECIKALTRPLEYTCSI